MRVADGQEKSPERPGQRSPAPHIDGPLGSSGAAPEEEPSASEVSSSESEVSASKSGMRPGGEPAEAGANTGLPSGATAGASDKSDSAIKAMNSGVTSTAESMPEATEAVRAGKPTTHLPAEAKTDSPTGPNAEPRQAGAEANAEPQQARTEANAEPQQARAEANAETQAEAEPSAATGTSAGPGNNPATPAEHESEPPPGAQAAAGANATPELKGDADRPANKPSDGTATSDKTVDSQAEGTATSTKTNGGDPKSKDDKARAEDSAEAGAGAKDNKAGDKAETKGGDKPETKGDKAEEKGDKAEEKPGDKTPAGAAVPTAAALAAASRGRATRVLRRANPVRVARSTARSTSAWAKRPSGRLILPAVIAALLLGAAGTAGAYLVPQALQSVPSPSATPGFGVGGDPSAGAVSGPAGAMPSTGGLPAAPGASAPTFPGVQQPVGGARPADVLASWAQQTGTQAGIPVVAVQAYGYAELVVGRTTPSCHLTWTTIAALAKVESSHGSANGAVLNVDGSVAPPIFGLPLDGKGGRQEIRDTDQGALDGDAQFDRAIGPLQFIPQTWTAISVGNGVDADNSGASDPNDIDDASLAAAKYLCQGGRDLAKPDAWWEAILSYNAVRPYAQKVFDAANDYGQRSGA